MAPVGHALPIADDLTTLLGDLAAEHHALDAVIAPLDDAGWDLPTPAAGWRVRDQIGHLTFFDGQATLAATDPDAFVAARDAALADFAAFEERAGELGREFHGAALLQAWQDGRDALVAAFTGLDVDARLPWYGPPMGTRSFLTARLMETWAHGQDVRRAVGLPPDASDRLRHIAHLGVVTRGWSYRVRGMEPPDSDVRVELEAPGGGEPWTWGPPDAPDRVAGKALDFCLVVTQRRHVDDTTLVTVGDAAAEWMRIAQCFAGGPTLAKRAPNSTK